LGKCSGTLYSNGTLYGELAKMAEPIDMPFWTKTLVGPRDHVLDGDADPQWEGAIFVGCLGLSKVSAIFAAAVTASFTAKGIIQSPVTSCSRRTI